MATKSDLNLDLKWHKILFENATEAIIKFDNNHRIIDTNKEFVELFKFNKKDIIGKEIDTVLNSANENSANKELTKKLLNGQDIKEIGVRYSKNGEPIHCLVRGIPVLINDRFVGGYAMYVDITKLHETQEKLRKNQKKYYKLVEELSEGLVLHNENEEFLFVNEAAEEIFGLPKEELIGKTIEDFVTDSDYKKIKRYTARRKDNKTDRYYLNILTKKGREKTIKVNASPINFGNNEMNIYAIIEDVTEQIRDKIELREKEKKFRSLFTSMSEGIALNEIIFDDNGDPCDFRILEMNDKFTEILGIDKEVTHHNQIKDKLYFDRENMYSNLRDLVFNGKKCKCETYINTINKHLKLSAFHTTGKRFGIIIEDITERIKNAKKIEYMNYHDNLTGLKNRNYLEENMDRFENEEVLPLGIIVGDTNGLKLINDIYGHLSGDELLLKVTEVLNNNCTKTDDIIRWGGDEFLILIPNSSLDDIQSTFNRIKDAFKEKYHKSIPISISIGYSLKNNLDGSIFESITEAEDYMYQNKLMSSRSIKNKLLNEMVSKLAEKSMETTAHALRMESNSKEIGKLLDLDPIELNKLKMISYLHDIGKITIPDKVLNKKGKLNDKEWEITKRHAEAGYKILISSEEFSHIALYVLHHHEWWNGEGYPSGLKGKDIPILSRIISVVDAFDAMTHERVYKDKMSIEEAKDELKKMSGIQFDPKIVSIFINEIIN